MHLRRNIEVNGIGDRVRVVGAALGAAQGKASFTVGRDTVNRVAKPEDKHVREVMIRTLDEVLHGEIPAIIKIDVEGFEAEVFRGASETLADPRLKAIITECLDEDVHGILTDAGFEQMHYDPEKRLLSVDRAFSSNNSLMIRKATSD